MPLSAPQLRASTGVGWSWRKPLHEVTDEPGGSPSNESRPCEYPPALPEDCDAAVMSISKPCPALTFIANWRRFETVSVPGAEAMNEKKSWLGSGLGPPPIKGVRIVPCDQVAASGWRTFCSSKSPTTTIGTTVPGGGPVRTNRSVIVAEAVFPGVLIECALTRPWK